MAKLSDREIIARLEREVRELQVKEQEEPVTRNVLNAIEFWNTRYLAMVNRKRLQAPIAQWLQY